ncbi:sporulation integral membrane protein YtvI [Halobacillus sp. A1]|uniref:sporulation integral membrane protein YtvI n=1 Tax=Halobacillus sp. A1 TaxID=2880262 RepID=UPI0020A6C4F6|nr:sporulation integral membrane protein YtvI [Halobacillus sp. A1]MCP3030553.1 sporulation integral membrane protein YtvI [Halobacillus sp. A1]
MNRFNQYQLYRLLLVLLSAVLLITALYFVWKLLFPFILAWGLAWFLQPYIKLLHNKLRIPKPIAILSMVGLVTTFFISLTTLFVTKIVYLLQSLSKSEFQEYSEAINVFHTQITSWLEKVIHQLDVWIGSINPAWGDMLYKYLNDLKDHAIEAGTTILYSILQFFSGGVASLPIFLMALGFIFIATFFISKDWETISLYFHTNFSSDVRFPIMSISSNFKETIKQLCKAQFTLMSITVVIMFFGLLIFRVPHPLALSLIAGAVDLVPYIGTGVIFVPWILYTFFTNDFTLTIQLTSLYMIIIITRQIFEPKILASHFGVPPLLLLIGLFLGFQIWGGLTILFTPLIIALIKAIHTSGFSRQLWIFILGK